MDYSFTMMIEDEEHRILMDSPAITCPKSRDSRDQKRSRSLRDLIRTKGRSYAQLMEVSGELKMTH